MYQSNPFILEWIMSFIAEVQIQPKVDMQTHVTIIKGEGLMCT
jgi:hypothetical protein